MEKLFHKPAEQKPNQLSNCWNLRAIAAETHARVDDTPDCPGDRTGHITKVRIFCLGCFEQLNTGIARSERGE